jgi:hypothetical protein
MNRFILSPCSAAFIKQRFAGNENGIPREKQAPARVKHHLRAQVILKKERGKPQPFDGVAFPPLRSKNPMRSYFSSPGVIASTGHCSAQAPQSVHSFESMTYLSSPSLIASTGHSS